MARKIMYCAMPTRFLSPPFGPAHIEKIKQKVRQWGYVPTVPFNAGPYEDFEGGPLGREATLQFMLKYQAICDAAGVFGISFGTMNELQQAIITKQELRINLDFDPEWPNYYQQLQSEFGDLLGQVRGFHHLIILVGPTAIGKTYWIDRIVKRWPDKIRRIKNTTTRLPRPDWSGEELSSYQFVTRAFFESQIEVGTFVEYDQFRGEYYGSNMHDIRTALDQGSGIFSLTPKGALAFYERRYETNLTLILLVPESQTVLETNFRRRHVDSAQWTSHLESVGQFVLPLEITHHKIVITGTNEDEFKILPLIERLI